MDETLYRRVLAALAATHAPSTAAHERANAYAELEAFKKVKQRALASKLKARAQVFEYTVDFTQL